MHLSDLETPALVLDLARFRANHARLAGRLAAAGVRLRPHVKTLKSADALLALGIDRSQGLCVSTLREAEHFLGAGWRDVTYTTALAPGRFTRLASLHADGAKLRVIVASPAVAEQLASFAAAREVLITAYVEVDCGAHRTGVPVGGEALLEIGRALAGRPFVDFAGAFTWAGHSYGAASREEIVRIAATERATALAARARLEAAGLQCRELSLGSTPTVLFAESFDGITEVRAGVYSLFDLFQAGLGCCDPADLALSVLATVLQVDDAAGQAIVDAGFLALSSDPGHGDGYGLVAALDATPLAGWRVGKLHQEHGFLLRDGAGAAPLPAPGGKLRLWPNHACSTAAGHDQYFVAGPDGTVVATWPRIHGW